MHNNGLIEIGNFFYKNKCLEECILERAVLLIFKQRTKVACLSASFKIA